MGLHADIYESKAYGNSSNNGISARFKAVTIVNIDGPFEPSDDAPAVELKWRGDYPYLVLAEKPAGAGVGPMAGGAFVYSSDSRFRRVSPGPVSLHDRYESASDYASND